MREIKPYSTLKVDMENWDEPIKIKVCTQWTINIIDARIKVKDLRVKTSAEISLSLIQISTDATKHVVAKKPEFPNRVRLKSMEVFDPLVQRVFEERIKRNDKKKWSVFIEQTPIPKCEVSDLKPHGKTKHVVAEKCEWPFKAIFLPQFSGLFELSHI